RTEMSDEMQALCFFAGASSIFYGDKLLTTNNPQNGKDRALLARLGIRTEGAVAAPENVQCSPPPYSAAEVRAFQQSCCNE
ncbi:MAG: hypothetical protein ACRETW_13095, partial [Stenotrophobium sp.]